MEEAKELTMRNQPEKKQRKCCRCGSIKNLRVSFKDFPVGIEIRKAKKASLEMALSKSEAKKSAEVAESEKERKYLTVEAAGEV